MAEKIGSILNNKDRRIWSMGPEETVYDAIALMAEKGSERCWLSPKASWSESSRSAITPARSFCTGSTSKDTLDSGDHDEFPDDGDPGAHGRRVHEDHDATSHSSSSGAGRRQALVGVISIGDLVNAIIAAQAHTIDQLHTYITGQYPA